MRGSEAVILKGFLSKVLVPPAPQLSTFPVAHGHWDFLFLKVKEVCFISSETKIPKGFMETSGRYLQHWS